MTTDGNLQGQHTVSFSETTWSDRLRRLIPFLPREIPLFAAVATSFWGIAEVLAELDGKALGLKNLAVPALVTALVVATYKAIQKFREYSPESLTSESRLSQSIFRKGKCGWQFDLALHMLKERTETFDRTLARIENGAHFIHGRRLDAAEYIAWLKDRPDVLIRLTHAVAVQVVSEIPSILATCRNETSLPELKDSVEQLASLYKETVDFELQSRSVIPPSEFGEVHEMIYGWSGPIRVGIRQFLEVLKSLSEISAREIKAGTAVAPSFQIKFESPPNIDEFVRRFGKVTVE